MLLWNPPKWVGLPDSQKKPIGEYWVLEERSLLQCTEQEAGHYGLFPGLPQGLEIKEST